MKWMTLTAALAATLAFAQTASAREHHYRQGVHREAWHHAYRFTEPRHYWKPQTYAFAAWNSDREPSRRQAYSAWTGERRTRRTQASATWAENRWARQPRTYAAVDSYAATRSYSSGLGGRPAAWCGWQMRQLVGSDPGPQYNLARNWVHWGHAGPPGVGAVVVWAHHVGKIVGQENGQWLIQSGNDGNQLRTRPRSIVGAIAIRWG